MKPTSELLRLRRAPAAKRPTAAPDERAALYERKRTNEADLEKLRHAAEDVSEHLKSTIATLRKESLHKPAKVAGAIAIRVIGATCNDKRPVPLPNLTVTLLGSDKSTVQGKTDATGYVLFQLPAAATKVDEKKEAEEPAKVRYKATVNAGDGSEVARVEADADSAHLVTVGDVKGVEAHAALGRGLLAALDKAEDKHAEAAKHAQKELASLTTVTKERLAEITKRLDLLNKK